MPLEMLLDVVALPVLGDRWLPFDEFFFVVFVVGVGHGWLWSGMLPFS
jgi:hypothetical protein